MAQNPLIGTGYDGYIGTRYKPGQPQAEYYNKETGYVYGNPGELVRAVQPNAGNQIVDENSVFDVLARGYTPRDSALNQIKTDLNQFQNETFNSGAATAGKRAASTIAEQIAGEKSNYETLTGEYNELRKRLNALQAPNYQQAYNDLRNSSGVPGIENEFVGNQKTIRELPYVNRMNSGNAGVMTEGQLNDDTAQKGIPLEIQQANLLDRLKLAESFINNSLKFKELDYNSSRTSLTDGLNAAFQTIGMTRNYITDLVSQQKEQREQQEKAQTFAFNNRIGKAFYEMGGTVYRTSDGRPATSPQDYVAMGGKGDFSDVQSIEAPKFNKDNIIGSAETGYYSIDPVTGAKTELIAPTQNNKFQLGNDAWGNPIVFNPKTGTYTGGDTSNGGSQPYYGLAPKVYDKAAAIVSQFDGEAIAKKYNIVADGNNYAQGIDPNTKNAAEHQALIYGLAKALDPDSVVREGEYATIQKYSQSWVEAFGFNAQRVVNNQGLLSADAIRKVQGVIRDKFNSTSAQYQNLYGEYARRIDAATGQQGKGAEMLTDYSRAYKAQSDPVLNNLWGDGFTTDKTLDLNKARSSGGLSFSSGTGSQARSSASPAVTSQASASNIFASAFKPGSTGGQCGDFARTLINKYGYDYPRVGDSIEQKMQTVGKSGSPANAWGIGTVLITNESRKNGHVAVINAITPKGYQVSESNYSLNGKVNHTRIIPFNSPKLIGGINPTRKTKTA